MSLPLIVDDGCANWTALEKWKDLKYIGQEFGNKSLYIMRYDKESGKNEGNYKPPIGMPSITFNSSEKLISVVPNQASNAGFRRNSFADFANRTITALE